MDLYSFDEGDALLIPTPEIEHLFTVITNPWQYEGSSKVILVNFSSVKRNRPFDQTCVVRADEFAHEFITRDSFVIYKFARLQEESKLIELRHTRRIALRGRVSNDCFRRMAAGIQRSDETTEDIKAAYRHYLQSQY